MIHRRGRHSLCDALDSYLQSRSLSDSSARTLTCSVRSLLKHLACEDCQVEQVTTEVLNQWLAAMSNAPRTIIKHRGNLLSLLRDAADDGHCPEPVARRVRQPRKPKPKPQAWTLDELRRVTRACDELPGTIRRYDQPVQVCVYFGCLVRVAYETGLRRGNLFALQQRDVDERGCVYVRHEKTGEPHVCTLADTTLRLLRSLPGDEPLRWRDNRSFYKRWRAISDAAGVPRGTLHRVRKTAATQVWLADQSNPTRVQQFLGHLTADMWRHYVDRSQGQERPPRPPAL